MGDTGDLNNSGELQTNTILTELIARMIEAFTKA